MKKNILTLLGFGAAISLMACNSANDKNNNNNNNNNVDTTVNNSVQADAYDTIPMYNEKGEIIRDTIVKKM